MVRLKCDLVCRCRYKIIKRFCSGLEFMKSNFVLGSSINLTVEPLNSHNGLNEMSARQCNCGMLRFVQKALILHKRCTKMQVYTLNETWNYLSSILTTCLCKV